MASQQQYKTSVVAVFLAALLLASPAASYRPEAAGYTPTPGATAEATPTEAAVSTPTEASTPAEAGTPVTDAYTPAAASSTPAELTPTEAAVSTPTEASTPAADGYKPGAAASTPAEATPTEAAGNTPTEATTPAESGTPVADGGYKPGAADSTPAEATPTDSTPTEASTPAEATPTDSTPTEASTPAESGTPVAEGYKPGAAASTPAEATPTESTPAEATPSEADAGTPVAPGYTPAAAASTTPAAGSAKATTDVQKLMEMVNAAYKKALEAANAAAPDEKFPVFDAAFDKGIKEGLADRIIGERIMFSAMISKAIKDAYVSTSGAAVASEEERFSVFVFTLTEALRVMAASLDAHAVKPAAEEAVAGGAKEPAGDQQVIGKIDAAVKAAADATKEAPLSDKFLVFEATFSKAFKDEMGPAYDQTKTIPQLNAAYKEAYKASIAATPVKRFDAFLKALTEYIVVMGKAAKAAAAKAGAASKPAAEATTEPAAEATTEPAAEATYKPAVEADAKPAAEAADKPAAEAAYKPATQAAAKPAGGSVGGYNL